MITLDKPKIYADLTFMINMTMDFVILWATAQLTGVKIVYFRLIMASLLGGIYSVGYLFPHLAGWYSLPVKVMSSAILVYLALKPEKWGDFKLGFLYFYGISFAAAGATIGFSFLCDNQNSGSLSYLWLSGGVCCVLFIGIYGANYLHRKIIPSFFKYRVKIKFDNIICSGDGFLDTGNGLRDPLTQRPVVIAEYKLLKNVLPGEFQSVMENIESETEVLEALAETSWSYRLRLIPFTSIGRKNGLLIGIRADEIVIGSGKRDRLHKNMVVGIYRDCLSAKGDYQLLIPSEILQRG